ncbi:MAG: DUF975 family protein [Pseudobutyrivibrio sp.]|nr:DUF975 family protein [Pseudobutyrivibrio sp.]
MKFPRKQIKANARIALSNRYGGSVGWPLLVGIILVLALSIIDGAVMIAFGSWKITQTLAGFQYTWVPYALSGLVIYFAVLLLQMFVSFVIIVGDAKFHLNIYRNQPAGFGTFFEGFKRFGHVLGGMLLMVIKLYLWTLLLIIPGIIKAYQYRMVPYLLIDRPELSVKECFKASKQMTDGHKWDLFVFDLSFIGWALLTSITLGLVGIFYVFPYIGIADAGCYDYLLNERLLQPVQQETFKAPEL